jgi:hypothetical protein
MPVPGEGHENVGESQQKNGVHGPPEREGVIAVMERACSLILVALPHGQKMKSY